MKYIQIFNEFKRNYTVDTSVDLKVIAKKIANELGYSRIRYISSGSYGDCWKVTTGEDTKVLKITTDMQEAKFAEKLRKINHIDHIVDYYDVRRIKSDKFKRYDVYSIIMEYVKPLEKHPDYYLIDAIIIFQQESRKDYIDYKYIISKLEEFGYDIDDKANFYINQLKETLLSLEKIGIPPSKVDLHSGNFGYKNDNTLVFFDISSFDFSWLKLKDIEF